MRNVVAELELALKKGRFNKSIELLRAWLITAEPGEPVALLEACTPAMRPHITVLLRDLLANYPSTVLGCPVLLYAVPELELDSPLPPGLTLPTPKPEIAKPCSDLHFLGWLPASAKMPVGFPFRPEDHPRLIPWHQATAAVALFRSHPGVLELDSLELPPTWWGELFHATYGNIRLEGQMLLSYPDALDTAAAMQAGARSEPRPLRGHFLTDVNWAHDFGVVFQEACRSHFPD